VFLPEHQLGVEFHGLVWHSEKFTTTPTRDFQKHKLAESLGIRIIHIYQDEWEFRPHTVKRLLLSAIGVPGVRVAARKTSVIQVSDDDAAPFFEDNHIQGHVNSPCRHYGLQYEGRIVAIMSFSRVTSIRGSRATAVDHELRRYATACTVVGGASKLLKAFLRDHLDVERVISYSDNRMYAGGMYEKLGFKRDNVSDPSYCYVKPALQWRVHKSKFKRSALQTREGFNFDPALSEGENCHKNGWYRLYDCGKTRWVLYL